jgi:glutathione S-transferase
MPRAVLHMMPPSHPAHAVRLMLEYKGVDFEQKPMLTGFHPVIVRLRGFKEWTVPALEIDGQRVQKSVRISRELDRLEPDPPLFPADAELRRRVEEAEEWGDRELQDYSRAILRWAGVNQPALRRAMAERVGLPLPAVAGTLTKPVAWALARDRDVSDERVREVLRELPAAIQHVDELIADGVIGADRPNAATFQLATCVRAFASFGQLWPHIESRPAGEMALALMPKWQDPLPVEIPRDWLPEWGEAAAPSG